MNRPTKPTSADPFDTDARTASERRMNPIEARAAESEKAGARPKGFIIHLKGLTEEQLVEELAKQLKALGHRIIDRPKQNEPK